jgi:hypothetical protein
MTIFKLKTNIFRVVFGSDEFDTYYIAKTNSGVWRIAQSGLTIDFAPTKKDAINVALTLSKAA